jgi:voltage-gated sodium channel
VAEQLAVTERLKRLTSSTTFNNWILALIILSSVLVGIETYVIGTKYFGAINLLQDAILWIFVAEQVLRIAACGKRPWEYFRQGWNLFDLAIIVICFLPLDTQFATVFRLARLMRTLRMVTALPRLQVLVSALLKSVPSLGYIGVLLGLHFYVYAVAGTFLFRQNDPIRFGSLHYSTLTLFEVLTLEGWNEVLNTQYNGSDAEYSDAWKELSADERVSVAQPLIAALYFVSFIMLGTMIMLNLFTGIIINSIEEAQAEQAVEVSKEHLKDTGAVTLHDELAVLSAQLQTLSVRLKGLELKELERQEETLDAEPEVRGPTPQ